MLKIKQIQLLLMGWVALLSSCVTQQVSAPKTTTKSITVSNDSAYTEVFNLPFDDKGQNFTLNVSFNESTDEVTIKVFADRLFMAFDRDTPYKPTFRHKWFSCRKMQLDRLPYQVLIQPNTYIYLPAKQYKKYAKKRKKHIFNSWFELPKNDTNTAVKVKATAPMVEPLIRDTLVRVIQLSPTDLAADFNLRNLLTLGQKSDKPISPIELKRNTDKKQKLKVIDDTDLRTNYKVKIQRNPCFYTVAETDSVLLMASAVRDAFHRLHAACPDGVAKSEADVGVFQQHREMLLNKFPRIQAKSDCTNLQQARNQYNAYLDSIDHAVCKYVPVKIETQDEMGVSAGLSVQQLLSAARKVDETVAQILVTKDATEARDLTASINNYIRTINDAISGKTPHSEDERRALNTFHRAVDYFKISILSH